LEKNKWTAWRFLPQKPPWYLWLAVGAFILGTIFISIGNINNSLQRQGAGSSNAQSSTQVGLAGQQTELMVTAREMEEELQGILEQIAGAGRVAVRVSLKASPLKEYATNTRTNKHSVEEKDQSGATRTTTDTSEDAQLVMARNGQIGSGEGPVVARETQPEVLGVVVVADGAGDPQVRARFIQAVQTLWGLAPYQVQVLPMKAEGSSR
jgi:stage III sporulation protein AG